jgi:small subunit ribosomal protein S18
MSETKTTQNKKKTTPHSFCYFCVKNIKEIDYKDVELLKKFMSSYCKIVAKKRSHVCNWHQRKLSKAIKRARVMGLVPFVED